MNNNLTEIVFLLDRSGSMSGLEADTIGGFNSLLEKQKKEPGEAILSAVLFDHECEVVYDRVNISKAEPMTEKQYYTRGSTALLDALGGAIHHIATAHRYARDEDRPAKTIFVITTDGMENASRRWTYREVRELVEREKEKYGWEFLFLGANIDAAAEARRFGIDASRAANYNCDEEGTALNFDVISDAVCTVRACEPLEAIWKERIDSDFRSRRSRR